MSEISYTVKWNHSLKSEITAEITVFSRNLKHFSVYYHPRLIIALKSQLKSSEITKSRTQNQPVPYPFNKDPNVLLYFVASCIIRTLNSFHMIQVV